MRIRFLICSTFFSCLFNAFLYLILTRSSYFSSVLFIRGNIAITLSFLICWVLLTIFSYFLYQKKIIELIIISFYSSALPSIALMLFHSLILVSLERSITVYTLAYIDTYYSEKIFDRSDFKKIIKSDYMENTNISSKRINEQINIGYIKEIQKGQYILTKKAKNFLNTSRKLAKIFNLRREFLWP